MPDETVVIGMVAGIIVVALIIGAYELLSAGLSAVLSRAFTTGVPVVRNVALRSFGSRDALVPLLLVASVSVWFGLGVFIGMSRGLHAEHDLVHRDLVALMPYGLLMVYSALAAMLAILLTKYAGRPD